MKKKEAFYAKKTTANRTPATVANPDVLRTPAPLFWAPPVAVAVAVELPVREAEPEADLPVPVAVALAPEAVAAALPSALNSSADW